jgi:hypothetical protein
MHYVRTINHGGVFMTPYGKEQQNKRIEMASKMFTKGRDIAFVKKIAGLTLAAMKLAGLIYEIIIPDPNGYTEDSEGNRIHNGHILHTNQWRPAVAK